MIVQCSTLSQLMATVSQHKGNDVPSFRSPLNKGCGSVSAGDMSSGIYTVSQN